MREGSLHLTGLAHQWEKLGQEPTRNPEVRADTQTMEECWFPACSPMILLSDIYTVHAYMAKDSTTHNDLSLFLHHLAIMKTHNWPIWKGQFLNRGLLLLGLSNDNQDYYCNFLQYFSIFPVDLILFPNETWGRLFHFLLLYFFYWFVWGFCF